MPKKACTKNVNKKMVIKALTDARFRSQLAKDPAKALGVKKITNLRAREIKLVLAAVKGIDRQVSLLADELLCANGGGGCSIA